MERFENEIDNKLNLIKTQYSSLDQKLHNEIMQTTNTTAK